MSQLKDVYIRLRWFYAHTIRTLKEHWENIQSLQAIVNSLNDKIQSLQTAHRAAITRLDNQHAKDKRMWIKEANKYLKEEATMRILHAELHNQLTDEIRSHYPPAIAHPESDTPIKQEQE